MSSPGSLIRMCQLAAVAFPAPLPLHHCSIAAQPRLERAWWCQDLAGQPPRRRKEWRRSNSPIKLLTVASPLSIVKGTKGHVGLDELSESMCGDATIGGDREGTEGSAPTELLCGDTVTLVSGEEQASDAEATALAKEALMATARELLSSMVAEQGHPEDQGDFGDERPMDVSGLFAAEDLACIAEDRAED